MDTNIIKVQEKQKQAVKPLTLAWRVTGEVSPGESQQVPVATSCTSVLANLLQSFNSCHPADRISCFLTIVLSISSAYQTL